MARLTDPGDLPDAARALTDLMAVAVMHVIGTAGPTTKGDIIAQTGASPSTVTARIDHLERVGLVTVSLATGERWGRRVVYDIDRDAVGRALDAQRVYLIGDGDA
jgi:DNA-binding MarR family transcriptional regulator